MATRKRASTRSKLLKRAVKAGRSALRQAESRVPPDMRRQLEKTIKDGQKTIHTAIKEVSSRLDRTARQADLDRAMKRLDALSKQVRKLASGATAAPARRKPATRKPAARKPATRKAAPRKAAPRRAAARRAPRASTPAPAPAPEPSQDGA